jgi:serine/threonine protein kinase
MADLTGKSILHYKILKQVGQGGMGIVYLAEDTKLQRQVAIKFLPSHIANNSDERERFKIEARAAAALNHPNISTIHAIEEVDDDMFIVMEYIDGMELKEKLKSGPISLNDSQDIATQIAKGLQTAHEKHIIHRDIKTANIMITDQGQVKIMDFGLAKMQGGIDLTQEQSTLGTAAYMSPEQARGGEVDHRTDIWSFGVVLYEMLTGQKPFKGDYQQGLIYSILNEEPDFMGVDCPAALKIILQKSLQKNVHERYQHMSDLLVELTTDQRDSVLSKSSIIEEKDGKKISPVKKMIPAVGITLIGIALILWLFIKPDVLSEGRIPIAVADFKNLSGEPQLNALSGMLITSLEQSKRLSVLTRSRMFDVLRQISKEDVSQIDEKLGTEICRKLNIRALAISTIRKFGQNYSIDLKIIDPISNEYLFTTRDDAESLEEIPLLIDRISAQTREGLQDKADELIKSIQRVSHVTTANLAAYQHYFKGKEYLDRLQYRDAEEELKKAVELDTSFGLATYQLAVAIFRRGGRSSEVEDLIKKSIHLIEGIPDREKYLVKARFQALNGNYSEAISILIAMEKNYTDDKEMSTMLARYAFQEGNFQLAKEYFEKVIRLDPEYELAWEDWGGSFPSAYILTGTLEDGLTKLQQLKHHYPGVNIIGRNVSDFYSYLDRFDEADQEYDQMIDRDQTLTEKIDILYHKAFFLPYRGKYREAMKLFDQCITMAKQAGDSSLVASIQTFKSILFVWGWNDVENAKIAARQSEAYHKHLIYPLTHSLLFFYQQDYDRALEIFDAKIVNRLIQAKNGNCKPEEITENSWKERTQLGILMLYHLAECQIQTGKFDEAILSLKELQKVYYNTAGFRAVYYPKSYYLLAKIYEKTGDVDLAIRNYQKFLEIWKDADNDLTELIDAQTRYAKLKGKT